ncbi:GNAT family N-acetyltransferase [Terribacillus sp. DMT04]|uniref:GNAT family N-acetyltransferase n=1 Tax=Terribacillus sp. DMT04 TaxID=2850441 RepID=UPI001C2BCD8F|nr:GNAT family N-acetyltransferase [Terribacillus sp. DMT04]QXE03260.1 GNAT family N-acetyltransferase [Terribacillus sp. DMT04]
MSKDIFRIATEADAPAFLELLSSAFKPLGEMGIDWPSTRATLEMVTDNIKNSTAVVLERDGRLLSTITIRFPWESTSPVSGYPFVWWFATAPDLAGQGIGNKLLDYVENTLLIETFKAPAYTLGTSGRKHPWLLQMYEGKGYKRYFEHENDNGDLGVLMYKVLIPERFDANVLGTPAFADKKVEQSSK